MSITDELRERAKMLTHWWYDPVKDEYTYTTYTMPPSIDAIRLDSSIIAIADRIDAEHQKALDERDSERFDALMDAREKGVSAVLKEPGGFGLVELPKDADGEHIHIGDVMEWPDGKTFDVIGIGEGVLFYTESECDGPAEWTGASTKRHYHGPTVEDVLREFAYGLGVPVADSYVAATAAKLRLAEGED